MNEHVCVHKNLSLYVSGDLDRAMRIRVDQHLSGCASCRDALQGQQTLFGALAMEGPVTDSGRGGRTWKLTVLAAAAVLVFAAGFVTARITPVLPTERPLASGVGPSRVYRNYVAAPSSRAGMFRVLGAVARSSENQ